MQVKNMKTLVIPGLLTLLLVAGVAPASAQDDKKPAQGQSPQAIRDGIERVTSRMWWNQSDKIAALKLTAEQRAEMDTLIRSHLEKQRNSTAMREAFAAFQETLEAGDWDGARKRAQGLADAAAEPVLSQAEMMIGALSLLSAEQRAKVASDYPGLMTGPWLRMPGLPRRLVARANK